MPQQGQTGLALRQRSAGRLAEVLAGADFVPFSDDDMGDPRDRALANRLVTTALRRHGHIEAILTRLLENGLPKRAGSFEAHLRLGLAQLIYLPEQGDHSAVHLAVEGIKSDHKARHFARLMNAVLRRAQAEAETLRALPPDLLVPEPLHHAWERDYGQGTVEAAADNLLSGAALDLTLKDRDAALEQELGATPVLGDTVRLTARSRAVSDLPGYAEGHWWVQDVAAAIPARLMHLQPGARVLDLCAAPGGKTAQLVKAGYAVTALDNSGTRLARLRQNLARLRYEAEIVEADAATYRPAAPFDGVLLDAPCSATGTFRRHPEVLWRRGAGRIAGRTELQRALAGRAVSCLNPGGVLIYCVCSLERAEGEDQARWVGERYPELVLDAIGVDEVSGLDGAVTAEGTIRTHPGLTVPGDKRGSLDGFFIARFRRR